MIGIKCCRSWICRGDDGDGLGSTGGEGGTVLSVHLASNEVTSEAANLIIRPHRSRVYLAQPPAHFTATSLRLPRARSSWLASAFSSSPNRLQKRLHRAFSASPLLVRLVGFFVVSAMNTKESITPAGCGGGGDGNDLERGVDGVLTF